MTQRPAPLYRCRYSLAFRLFSVLLALTGLSLASPSAARAADATPGEEAVGILTNPGQPGAELPWRVLSGETGVMPLAAGEKPAGRTGIGSSLHSNVKNKPLVIESARGFPVNTCVTALIRFPESGQATMFAEFYVAKRDAPENAAPPAAKPDAAKGKKQSAKMEKPDIAYRFMLRSQANRGAVQAQCGKNNGPLHDLAALSANLPWASPYSNSFAFTPRAYEQFLPGWPESFRAHIEADMASQPALSQRWFVARIELRPESVKFFLDDRLVGVEHRPGEPPAGAVRAVLGAGTQLAMLRVEPLAPASPGFVPICIDSHVNAARLAGDQPANLSSVAVPGTPTRVHGIPMQLPRHDAAGNDHVSLARSLFRQGNSSGYLASNGPRYAGASLNDPARIQLRLANGNFNALYVLAACDDSPDAFRGLTAVFYRPDAGFAQTFEARVPTYSAPSDDSARKVSITLANGKPANLWLVRIPLDPGALSSFADLDIVELELTKQVELFRSYPDPISYGWHGAGLPSSAHIYAMTLGTTGLDFSLEPDVFGHVWQSPAQPGYSVSFSNRTDKPIDASLRMTTRSFDGKESTQQETKVTVAPGGKPNVQPIKLAVQKFGYHELTATLDYGGETWTEKRSFVKLAPDTRSTRWTDGRGALFGYWSYHGGHYTPRADHIIRLMTMAGARQSVHPSNGLAPETLALIEKHWGPGQAGAWEVKPQNWAVGDYDKSKVEPFQKEIIAALNKYREKISIASVKPDSVYFYAEPHISSRLTAGNPPDAWGDKPFDYTDDEKKRIEMFFNTSRLAAEAVRRDMPGVKVLIPWGDPGFVWPLLRAGFPKNLIDGSGIDIPGFERIPERQLHEQSIHRLYLLRREFAKAGIDKPRLQQCEGIFVPTEPGAVTPREQMDIYQRWNLLSMAYGVDRFYAGWFAFDCGSYYGAEHYGGCGIQRRIPYCDPKPAYAAFATMTDKLNEANFDGWLPTGSHSTYCLRFRKADNKGFVYALWSLRGSRDAKLTLENAGNVFVTDSMNNTETLTSKEKSVTVRTSPSVVYVTLDHAKGTIAAISLDAAALDDSLPGRYAKPLADLGDGSWKLTNERDAILEGNHWAMMHYPGKFDAAVEPDESLPKSARGATANVLVTTLGKQDAVHELMPWYNVLRPKAPIVLPGAPSHLGLWVRGASDWGRVIYVLRDAKGERWTSIGTKDNYNCDDVHSWSSFIFDGWRYLSFELPGHTPYDNFRKPGTTWWRSDKGDGVVDLPLSLEAVIVEQRTHILYVNDIQPVASNRVALGRMLAEYANSEDAGEEAVRLSKLRTPMPTGVPDLPNPIERMTAENPLPAPTKITKLVQPEHYYDGTRMHVHFEPSPNAAKTFLWVSAHADGRGAVNLTPNGLKPGQLVNGLRPEIKLHYWLTYTDDKGAASKPSPRHEEITIDNFKEK